MVPPPHPSKSQEQILVFPFGACIPSRCNVSLRILAGKSFLIVWLSPFPWACGRSVTVFNVNPAQITHIVICEPLDEVEQGRCWWVDTAWQCLGDEPWWSLGEEPTHSASTSLLPLFLLPLLVVGKWCTFILSTSAPCAPSATSVAPVLSAPSPSA